MKDLDPVVERVILRCLETDPAKRPSGALAVAAALPGGDPLAAALAAGETPSPQMVAAAGETTGLAPRIAVASLAAVILGIAAVVALGLALSGLHHMKGVLPPDVLQHKAHETLEQLGYAATPWTTPRSLITTPISPSTFAPTPSRARIGRRCWVPVRRCWNTPSARLPFTLILMDLVDS